MGEYIFHLEESLVSLTEAEEGLRAYEAKSKVKKIKNKMKKRKASKAAEQSEEDNQYSKKRTALLIILKQNNPDKIPRKSKLNENINTPSKINIVGEKEGKCDE